MQMLLEQIKFLIATQKSVKTHLWFKINVLITLKMMCFICYIKEAKS